MSKTPIINAQIVFALTGADQKLNNVATLEENPEITALVSQLKDAGVADLTPTNETPKGNTIRKEPNTTEQQTQIV